MRPYLLELGDKRAETGQNRCWLDLDQVQEIWEPALSWHDTPSKVVELMYLLAFQDQPRVLRWPVQIEPPDYYDPNYMSKLVSKKHVDGRVLTLARVHDDVYLPFVRAWRSGS